MDKCDNCDSDAVYLNRPSRIHVQLFCAKHVPWFLKKRAINGSLELANQVMDEAPAEETPKTKKRKAVATDEQPNTENTDEAGAPSTEDFGEAGAVS